MSLIRFTVRSSLTQYTLKPVIWFRDDNFLTISAVSKGICVCVIVAWWSNSLLIERALARGAMEEDVGTLRRGEGRVRV